MNLDMFSAIRSLEHKLDYQMQRHAVLTSNLANADTPHYVPKDLSFQAFMDNPQMQVTNPLHQGGGQAAAFAVTTQPFAAHHDGNGVEIEKAMSQLQHNRLAYEEGIEITRRNLSMLRYAASNGGGQ